jgi:1-acyl-sn-glycerol-3-phosphate acyltransferase
MIRTLLVGLFLAVAVFLLLPWFVLGTFITGDADRMYNVAMKACRVGCRIAGLKVHVEGAENIPPGVCVFVVNHASNLDPLAFFPWVHRRFSVLIKEELSGIPVLGKGMRMAGFVFVRRNDRESTAASLEACRERLRGGLSMVIFPEGTRSRDGRLRPFKRGAFVLAIEAGVPIVPVSIVGTPSLLTPGSLWLRPGSVTTRIGTPVDAAQYNLDRRLELTARVHDLVAAGLPPEQQPLEKIPGAAGDFLD